MDRIPRPLLDRMELIELPGYTSHEKLIIARQFLVPKQLSEHGLTPERLEITDELVLPRDKDGDIDVRGTTELVTNIIEDWVREYPEQWLWMHRRWG